MIRRVTLLWLSIFIFSLFSNVGAVFAAEIAEVENSILWGGTASKPNLAVWGGYIYAATDQGLKIFDLGGKGGLAASWDISKLNTVLGTSSSVPSRVAVNDKYIAFVIGTQIAVFPNEKVYTDTPPSVIRKLDGLGGDVMMLLDDDNIYAFVIQSRGSASGRPANFWKIKLENIDKFPADANKRSVLTDSGILGIYVERVSIGTFGALWNTVSLDGNYAYCTVYSILDSALFSLKVNINDITDFKICTLIQSANSISTGIIALDRDYMYVFANSSPGNLFVVEKSNFSLLNEYSLNKDAHGDYQDALIVGNAIFGLIKNKNTAGVIDVSDPKDIVTNISEHITIGNGKTISTGNTNSNIVKLGNRLYYAYENGTGLGVVRTRESQNNMRILGDGSCFPIIVTGVYTDGDEVEISLGGSRHSLTVTNSVWQYPIYALPNGMCDISVTAGGVTHTGAISINVPAAFELTGISASDGKITGNVTNKSELYVKSMRSDNPYVALVVYSADNKITGCMEKSVTSSFDYDTVVPTGGYARLYAFNNMSDLSPLSPVYTINAGGAVDVSCEAQMVTGVIKGNIEVVTSVAMSEKKVYIKGNVPNGANCRVAIKVSDSIGVKEYNCTIADNEGNFEFSYSFEGSSASNYSVTVGSPCFSGVKSDFYIDGDEAFSSLMEYIKSSITDGSGLSLYLNVNPDSAVKLGIELENAYYIQLTDYNKSLVMEKVLLKIKEGKENEIRNEFISVSQIIAEKQDIDNLNNASVSNLLGLLGKFAEQGKISAATFRTYENMGQKIAAVNSAFIGKGKINAAAEIEPRLIAVMNEVNTPVTVSKPSGSSSGSGGGSGSSKITVPPAPVIVPVLLEKSNTEIIEFSDLSEAEWAKDSILYLKMNGIIDGVDKNRFVPNDFVTREQFIKLLIAALDLKDENAECTFSDVEKGQWYYEYIASAQKLGLAKGDGEAFGVGRFLTREEMSVLIFRALENLELKIPLINERIAFEDDEKIEEYAKTAVEAMQRAGIMNGIGGNMFAPKENCTRAMSAKVIFELINSKE